jgi:hypothetical protein
LLSLKLRGECGTNIPLQHTRAGQNRLDDFAALSRSSSVRTTRELFHREPILWGVAQSTELAISGVMNEVYSTTEVKHNGRI